MDKPLRGHSARRRRWSVLPIGCLTFIVAVGVAVYLWYFRANDERIVPDYLRVARPVFYSGEFTGYEAKGEKENLSLPIGFYRDKVDPNIFHEAESGSVVITTAEEVMRLRVGHTEADLNDKPVKFDLAPSQEGDALYLPVKPLQTYYGLDIRENAESGAVLIAKEGERLRWGSIAADPKKPGKTVPVRTEPYRRAPIVTDLPLGEEVLILEETEGWYKIQRMSGAYGFVKSQTFKPLREETVPRVEREPPFVPWKPAQGKINLTWQQVSRKHPDTSKIGPMPGLNVMSPQWFHLLDGKGNIQDLGDPAFAAWARNRGYQLWALFSNGFEPKRTNAALASYDTRMRMIRQLLQYAETYKLNGINVDFENVYLKDKVNMVQFMRELVPMLHARGLTVSIDVTVKSTSDTYSRFLDRRALSAVVDYMIVMGYDEHWATSPRAGSVASLPWVETGIARILTEDAVPPGKLILGVPYYTRIWTENPLGGPPVSKAVSMSHVKRLLADKKLAPEPDPDTGQRYVEYREGDGINRIWIEDAFSMKSRVELVNKYGLAGIASWSRGMESPDIWEVILDTLAAKP